MAKAHILLYFILASATLQPEPLRSICSEPFPLLSKLSLGLTPPQQPLSRFALLAGKFVGLGDAATLGSLRIRFHFFIE